MGKFINNAVKMWSSLEDSFEKSGIDDRKTFLLKLCGEKDGSHKLDLLKSSVMSEYESDPANAEMLISSWDRLAKNWKRVLSTENISNLDMFLLDIADETSALFDVDNFFASLNPYKELEVPVSTFSQVALSTGFLTDTIKEGDKGVEYSKVPHYDHRNQIFVFKQGLSAKEFVNLHKEGNEFISSIQPVVMGILRSKEVPGYFMLVGKENFNKRKDAVTISLGSEKIRASIKETFFVEKSRVLLCQYSTGYDEYPIYCIS